MATGRIDYKTFREITPQERKIFDSAQPGSMTVEEDVERAKVTTSFSTANAQNPNLKLGASVIQYLCWRENVLSVSFHRMGIEGLMGFVPTGIGHKKDAVWGYSTPPGAREDERAVYDIKSFKINLEGTLEKGSYVEVLQTKFIDLTRDGIPDLALALSNGAIWVFESAQKQDPK